MRRDSGFSTGPPGGVYWRNWAPARPAVSRATSRAVNRADRPRIGVVEDRVLRRMVPLGGVSPSAAKVRTIVLIRPVGTRLGPDMIRHSERLLAALLALVLLWA